ncbi:hypothetical protein N7448_006405 [Penicillium atrosanguineum]|uniref:DUF7492 domain-containing protein n=1 Tax=Penicillium atrosanguineum TaxID=1132637 RepID=A0A9W9GY82_9EURO|nr:uncharacterized protein N7443_010165 [Penicillium atrosanguineum]KAJ5132247.1 hypothetical protein N7448_006405 [Penicillium atrosanguineum]KAJ5137542.1 hypothetical protein N7526_003775 [Penicillium atrosanguineum]KAJ5289912.1 hypothetical protein N7443_010165 [Penicillium atrosanguineum]KAJ5307736.1 hypothetical protein N7476_008392 [Penicillium atrosanguineum]
MKLDSIIQTFWVLPTFVLFATAHSWVEQLTVIAANGTFTGTPGYARGNWLRTAPGFNDTTMTYLIPPDGSANVTLVLPTDKLCKNTQQTQTQSDGSPRLKASAGAAIALRYQENGHVTLPWNQPGKPKNRGTVYVYGTTEPKVGETLLDVHGAWTADGTGGDKRGVLLSTQNFDDGRCYQINTGNISEARQTEYPHQANSLMGADLWCQQDVQLPATAPSGKLYTLYWVWDWPTAPGVDPTYPQGKKEIYTTCMDIDVTGTTTSHSQEQDSYATDQNLDSAAIPSEFADLDEDGSAKATQSPLESSSSSSSAASSESSATATTIWQTFTSTIPTVTETAWRTMEKTVTVRECQATGATSAGQ